MLLRILLLLTAICPAWAEFSHDNMIHLEPNHLEAIDDPSLRRLITESKSLGQLLEDLIRGIRNG